MDISEEIERQSKNAATIYLSAKIHTLEELIEEFENESYTTFSHARGHILNSLSILNKIKVEKNL